MRGERTYRAVRLFVAVCALVTTGGEAAGYYGVRMGPLSQLNHGVKGEVYAVDSRTLHLRGFYYDGQAPDAFFYAGSTPRPSDAGFIIPDEKGGKKPLGRYSNQDVTITLPEGKTLKDITWFSIWCRAFAVDFGHVIVDKNLNYPRPQKIDSLPTLEHGVTSDRIVVVDAQTFLIPNFSYDGAAPDAYFWVGKGSNPGPSGILVPDENGSEEPLKRYSGKTIVITLPGDLTVFDIDFLGVWCRAFHANFGHVRIPKSLNVPPSLKMLGVAPQTKLNCEVLWDDLALEVRWAVAGESIVMQLVARISDGQYMSFGTSGSLTRSVMVGGDVVVAWLDQTTGRGVAEDYHLTAKAQCQGGQGSCPDEKLTGGSNNVRLLNAALINDFTMLTFQRPLRAVDRHDAAILTNGSQAVIWAVGPINSQGDTSYHSLRLRGDMFIDFGRTPKWNCPLPEEQSSTSRPTVSKGPVKPAPAAPAANPWYIPPIPCYEPEDGVFYAQIGPTGGTSGYNSITGHVGWGISWYINGLLIPEINVVRGKSYTFVVEGGFDPEVPSRYHPFYITDDPEGGYEFKTPAERSRVKVLAGVEQDRDGSPVPSAYGRLCEWHEDPNQPASTFTSFGAYQRTLKLDCQEGQPGVLQWTPDANTPDTVYYQCYTHRFLGWKINVLDQCDYDELAPAGSVSSAVVLPGAQANPGQDYDDYDYYSDDRGGEGLHAAGSRPPRPHRQPQDHSNRISQGAAKPTRSSESRDPKPQPRPQSGHLDQKLPHDFPLVNFPQEFQGGFESFPFNMSPDDIGPVGQRPFHPDSGSSAQNVPLGVPGFIFPKLPNLKSSTGIVNATAFANLGNANLGSVPRDVPKEFLGPQKGDLEFSQHKDENFQIRPLRNKYPSSPKPTQQTTRFTSLLEPSTPRLASPKNDFPLQFTLSTSSKISVGSSGSIPTRTTVAISDTSSNEPEKEISNEYFEKTKTFTRPDATRQPAPTIPTRFPTSDQPTTRSRQTISVNPTIPFMLSMTTNHPTNTKQPTNPTLSNKFNVTPKQSTSLVPSSTSLQQTRHQPLHREPEVITAPSLPLLPFQAPLAFQGPSSGRRQPNNGGQIYKTTPAHTTESPATTLDESFAQNFGFDPESVVYESDFRPVKKNPAGPLLAFEVSSSDIMPVRAPRPPHPPQVFYAQRPVGPRTSSALTFAKRHMKIDDVDESHDDDLSENHKGKRSKHFLNPILHDSVTFSESLNLSPLPMPVPMAPVVARLGGAASNRPLSPNRPIIRLPNKNHIGPRRPIGPVRPSGSVNRMGLLQVPKQSLRRMTAMVPLPDDHAVPFPQLVGPEVLKPVLVNFPLEYDEDGEDMLVAASTQVFTSDGRPLEPDSLPTPPQFTSSHRRTAASITNRPKTLPFRGELPPPVPAKVPHLTQFSRQRRPFSRPTTIALPSAHGETSSPIPNIFSSGSAPRPVIVAHTQNNPHAPAALLAQGKLSADVGHNVVVSISHHSTAAGASTSTRSPTLTASSAATNQTNLTILKDVWSILTRDNPDLKSEHPREEAHPQHDHLDRQERRKRFTSEKFTLPHISINSTVTSGASTYSFRLTVVCICALNIMMLAQV